ncbi:MAG: hypothetical protein L0J77_07880 [Marinobacter sp.]|nr:hypothetical protein [Marinobacter sp.]
MTPEFLLFGLALLVLSAGPHIVMPTVCQQTQEYVGTGALLQAFLSKIGNYVMVSTEIGVPLPHFTGV